MKRIIISLLVILLIGTISSCSEEQVSSDTKTIETVGGGYDYTEPTWNEIGTREDLSKTAREIVLEKDGFLPELETSWRFDTPEERRLGLENRLNENGYITIYDDKSEYSTNYFDPKTLDLRKFNGMAIEPEPDSYWPERHLGKLKYIPLPDVRVLVSEKKFKKVRELAEFYFDKTFNGSLSMIDETGSKMPLNYDTIRINKNIWVMNVYYYGDFDSLQYFSILESTDDDKLYQRSNWFYNGGFNDICGVADINGDEYTEFIHNHLWTSKINIITCRNNKLELMVFDVDGMQKADSFLGFDNGFAHFTTSNLGYAIYSHHEDVGHSEASYRFASEHVLQIRGDDVYDVTYRYPGRDIMGILASIRDNRFEYFNPKGYSGIGGQWGICCLESIGLTREAHEIFLKQKLPKEERYRNEEKKIKSIIDFSYKNDKPYHVQKRYDVPTSIDEDWFWFKLRTH